MIGQFVYTRTSGSILLGYDPYKSNQNVGWRCVGCTPGIANADWNILNSLSNCEVVAPDRRQKNTWLPVWTLNWLPSGALAVGKTTFFEEENSLERGNHVTHYYIIDHKQAMENSGHMERLFTLPFIDYDLNKPVTEQQRYVLRDMQEYETLEQAGMREKNILPLGSLLDDHLRIYLDLVRNIVEGTLDAALYRERQMMCAYNSDDANAEELYWSLMGWIYRLIPKHLRDRVGFSMPYNLMSSVNHVQLTMVPECNVKISPYSHTCRNSFGEKGADIEIGCSYLYTDARISGLRDAYGVPESGIYHARDKLPELYNSGMHYFSVFLEEYIRALYYNSAENAKLQSFYDQLYRDGWKSDPLLGDRVSLELMAWHSGICDNKIQMEEESSRRQMYTWLERLKALADHRVLPEATCADLQELVLLRLCSMDETEPDESWIEALKNLIAAPTRNTVMKNYEGDASTLAGVCIGLAAVAVAKVWEKDFAQARAKCTEWFGKLKHEERSVEEAILDLLTNVGDRKRQTRWSKAGVKCDETATQKRISELMCCDIAKAGSTGHMYQAMKCYGQPLEQLSQELLEKTAVELTAVADKWMEQHVDMDDEELLYPVHKEHLYFQDKASDSNLAWLCSILAKHMWEKCLDNVKSRYQAPSVEALRELRALISKDDSMLQTFYQDLFDSLLPQVVAKLEKDELYDDMIIDAHFVMVQCCYDARSTRLYDNVCRKLLSIGEPWDAVIWIPSYVDAQWLYNLEINGYLYCEKGLQGANVLTLLNCLLNHKKVNEELGRIVGREESDLLQKRLAWLYKNERYLMAPSTLYRHIKEEKSGLRPEDALYLLEYRRASAFYRYVMWLKEQRYWKDLLWLLDYLSMDQRLHKMGLLEFKNLMTLLRSAYEGREIPWDCMEFARFCSKKLWDNYRLSVIERMNEKDYVIKPSHNVDDHAGKQTSDNGTDEHKDEGNNTEDQKPGVFGWNKKKNGRKRSQKKPEYSNVNITDEPRRDNVPNGGDGCGSGAENKGTIPASRR